MQKIFNKKIEECSGNTKSTSFLQATSYKLPTSSFGLVEVVVGVSILGVSISILFGVIFFAQRIAADATTQIQATLFLQEGAEIARYIRDAQVSIISPPGWNNIVAWGNNANLWCPYYASGALTLTFSTDAGACATLKTGTLLDEDKFTRTMQFSCAERQGSNIVSFGECDAIPQGGNTIDTDTIKVLTTVSWVNRKGQTQQGQLETIITNR